MQYLNQYIDVKEHVHVVSLNIVIDSLVHVIAFSSSTLSICQHTIHLLLEALEVDYEQSLSMIVSFNLFVFDQHFVVDTHDSYIHLLDSLYFVSRYIQMKQRIAFLI